MQNFGRSRGLIFECGPLSETTPEDELINTKKKTENELDIQALRQEGS
jgi:hypothetical protein